MHRERLAIEPERELHGDHMTTQARFAAGRNIAMKAPPHLYEATVGFYRDVLDLREITKHSPSVAFEFGSNNLWIDRVTGISQAEIWLEAALEPQKTLLYDLRVAAKSAGPDVSFEVE